MAREIETKYRVRDPDALLDALAAAGVELGAPARQDDQAYAPRGWDPSQGKAGFTFARLRTQGRTHTVTTKTPVANAMECVEHETAVADPRRFKALADPARVQLLSIFAAHEGHEACVCDLTDPVGLSQPTVSHHLKILVDAGLLHREQRGRWAYYSLVPGAVPRLAGSLAELAREGT